MTQKLQKAIEKLQTLPAEKQDQMAGFLLQELNEDAKWEATTAKHRRRASKLVEEVLEDERQGKTSKLNPESL
jgi:hypothetical protein